MITLGTMNNSSLIPLNITAPQLAIALLGQTMVSLQQGQKVAGIITETEAYSYYDKGCHAYNNKITKRNAPLFMSPGHWYIYFTYGMHWCANITAELEGQAGGVLIRSLSIDEGLDIVKTRRNYKVKDKNLTNGPAKICQALAIGEAYNGLNVQNNSSLYIEFTSNFPCYSNKQQSNFIFKRSDGLLYKTTPRVGLGGNHEDINKLWRYIIQGNSY
jgi:DNA-3-methyladenine glycosylase